MAKLTCRSGVLFVAMLTAYTGHASAQLQSPASNTAGRPVQLSENPTHLTLSASETQVLALAGAPQSFAVVEIRLDGGLVWVQSQDAPARLLDLGRGGHLRYAVQIDGDGSAKLEFRSAEHLRDAELRVHLLPGQLSDLQAGQLHAAEIDFASADSTRRHQTGAPNAIDALLKYDHAAAEADAAGDPSLVHWILNQKARFLLYQKSSFVEPHEILLRAAALPSEDDTAEQALTYKTLSSCEYFMGNLEAAVAAAERALALYRATGDIYWQGVVLSNLIADYSEMGRNEDAVRAGQEALADAEQAQDTAGVVFCLTELANLYRLEGNPQAAFQAFREAEAWSQDIRYAPLILAEIEQGLGQFYMDMGLWDEAQRQFRLCLHMASADSPAALEVRALLATTLARHGAGAGALAEYRSAIAAAHKLKLEPEEIQLHIERSATLLKLHRINEAKEDAQAALHMAETSKDPALRIGAILASGAAGAVNCGRADPCKSEEMLYRQAIALMDQSNQHEQEAVAYAGIAPICALEGKNEAALEAIEHALTVVEHSRSSLSSNVLAAGYFEEWHEWYALAEQISLNLDQLHPGAGYREIAFRYSERVRARAMLDAIGSTQERPAQALSPPIARQVALDEKQIESDQAKLLTTGSSGVAEALAHLYREQDQMAAARSSAGEPSITSLKNLEDEFLGPDDVLIAFSSGYDRTVRWLVTHSSVQVERMPGTGELQQRLAPLRKMLLARKPAPAAGEDATRYGERLTVFHLERDRDLERAGALLLGGVPRSTRHLYVVADGDLSSLPWSALRVPCGSKQCYAVERFAISMEPSVSIAAQLARRIAEPGKKNILVVSGTVPIEGAPGPRWSSVGTLPGSQREAREIEQLATDGTVERLSGARATPDNVRTTLRQETAVLHLATHTLLVSGHPELSGIALSPDAKRSSGSSGVLWLHDIPSLHVPPLVTLSGCATQGTKLDGEDLNTLTQAFFYAGAQQVVASLWSIDDDATASLMQEFYRNLLSRRMEVADGMRSAQLRMIARHADLSDWAAFIVNGVPARASASESARN